MKTEFFEIKESIKKLAKGRPVYYIQNSGNCANAIIRYASLKFFDDSSIKYVEISRISWVTALKVILTGGTFICSGGSIWGKHWSSAQKIVNNILNLKKINPFINIIVLPSTFEFPYNLSKVIVFARDKDDSIQNVPNAKYCPDMAFYLDKMDILPGDNIGYFFRKDNEGANVIKIPSGNLDLINEGNERYNLNTFYHVLIEYSVIYTDSLHVAIAGCQIGREVHFYPSFSFKNKAVYESSMKVNFDNLYFHDDFEFKEQIKPPFLL